AFAPDGRSAVVCSQAGVRELDWPALAMRRRLNVDVSDPRVLAFSPSGDRLLIAGGRPAEAGAVAILAWPSGEPIRRLPSSHDDAVSAAVWLSDERAATASLDSRVFLRASVGTAPPPVVLDGHSKSVTAVATLPDDGTLVSAGVDASLRVWNISEGTLLRSLGLHAGPIHAVAARPANEGLPVVASIGADRTVRFWQPTIGRMVRFARLPSPGLSAAWLPDGSRLAVGCQDGCVRLVDPLTVRVVKELRALPGWVDALAVHPAGDALLAGGSDGRPRRLPLDPVADR
ncbi:MAG: hypothetical protein AAF907_12610, partial [Planctomycetota bacterium]